MVTSVAMGGNKHPEGVAVDATTHTVYVTSDDSTVSVIDGRTNSPITSITVDGTQIHPSGIGMDPTTHVVYVANFDTGTVSVISGVQ